MRKYNVCLYPTVQVKLRVNAESPEQAARQAEADFLTDPSPFIRDGEHSGDLESTAIVEEVNSDSSSDPDIGETYEIDLSGKDPLDYRQILEQLLNMSDPDHPEFVDSGADVIDRLWTFEQEIRSTGSKPALLGSQTTLEEKTMDVMVSMGGSFVQSLSAAYRRADSRNRSRIRAAFPEIWEAYQNMAQDSIDREKSP